MNSRTWKLDIASEQGTGVLVVAVAGRLGADSSGRLQDVLLEAIDAGNRRIVVDLTAVDYLNSAGASALDVAFQHMTHAGGRLMFCGMQEPVRLVLDMTGLLASVTPVATRSEALRELGQPPQDPQR